MEFESTCLFIQNSSSIVPWSPRISEGIHLEVTKHPFTMRRMANLIIATERFKGSQKCSIGTEFRDQDLLNVLLEALDEQIVLEVEAPPPSFIQTSNSECDVTDTDNKSLVLEAMELHAILLQAGNNSRKVQLNLSAYVATVPSVVAGRPVALNIKGSNLYLSCSKSGDKPILQLEVANKEQLNSISSQSEMVRFLFYRRDTGTDISTLESARFKDWFISTDKEDNAVVNMCNGPPSNRIITFNLQTPSKTS
ncbi:interleukin-1 beta isoform X2 [Esox lucius]|uniref:interleukin-1 beta isoform X2 n=1 Tax=Esox lucius TaxID=8010 RepID=UPI0014772CD5|nr:interleukin-1 beta isoform X2 [Esox lucius]